MNTNLQQTTLIRRRRDTLPLLIRQLRPKQWTKNILVFSALIFSLNLLQSEELIRSIYAFFCFCFVSSCVYIINDYADLEADRSHPEKRNRPMASGLLSPTLALTTGVLLLVGSVGFSFYLDKLFGALVLGYFIVNVLYSFRLKHVVIVDILIIASGFVLRSIGGGLVIHVPITPWFLLCIMLLALFLAIGKRRHELVLLETNASGKHRKVLQYYSLPLLDQMNSIVTSATILCYALFTFTAAKSVQLMWTVPFVVYGIFRYLYLIHIEKKGGSPDRLLFEDKHLLVTVILYAITTVLILYVFK